MTNDEQHKLGKRMERLEQSQEEMRAEMRAGFNRLERALTGDLDDPDSKGGIMGRLRAQEDNTARHELRIGTLETWRDKHERQVATRHDFEELATAVEANTKWRESLSAQWRLLMLMGGGNLIGLLGVIYALARLASEGG